jgi:cytochrome c oxidase subunit IV
MIVVGVKAMAKHITSERTYYLIFAALIALTLLTVGLSYVELGAFHLIVGLAIASTKAVLVILFFMHLLYSNRLSWTMFLSGLFWLGILLVLTLSDYLSRNVLSY